MSKRKPPLLLWGGLLVVIVAISKATAQARTGKGAPVYRGMMWPVENKYVTLKFAATSPSPPYSKSKPHKGLDIDLKIGDPVEAIVDGTITHVVKTDNGGLGKYVVQQFVLPYDVGASDLQGNWQNIKAGTVLYAAYGHLSDTNVTPGQPVRAGQTIGKGGNSGLSIPSGGGDGSHLHLEIGVGKFENRDVRDPLHILIAAIPGLQSQVRYV
jgi:murein DD-endopeptidase MepM/ murein hydrolase activator NlpD